MSRGISQERLRLRWFTFAGLLGLVAFVFFLLYHNYRTTQELNGMLQARLLADAHHQASTLDHFMLGRQDDLRSLAASEEIKGYFFSLAQGTSEEYGLAASRAPIEILFRNLIAERQYNRQPVYSRLKLLDRAGQVIGEFPRRSDGPASADASEPLLQPQHRTPTPAFVEQDASLRFSLAYYYAGEYAGQLLAWVNPDALFSETREHQVLFLRAGSASILPPAMRQQDLGRDLAGHAPSVAEQPTHIALEIGGRSQFWVLVRLPLQCRPLDAVVGFPAASASTRLTTFAMIGPMSALATIVLGGALLIFYLNTRSLILQARLETSLVGQNTLTERNRLLEIEIQERKRVETELSRSEKNYREMFNATKDSIFLHEAETGRILDVNQAALDTLGQARSELIGRTLAELSADETSKAAEYLQGSFERARLEGPQLFESSLRRANGEPVQVEVVLKCSHIGGQGRILAVARDISERKNSEALQKTLQEQLVQAGKLDSIGRLAGGVAHDFNNLLTVILGHLYLVLEQVPAEQKDLRCSLEEVGKAANRASELTRQLLAFSRKQMLQMRQLDLNESIVGVGRMLQRLIGEDIEVSTVLNPAIRPLRADPTQIEQVIMNLAINARDAMPDGGRLTIQTSAATLDESYAAAHPDSRPGAYVLLTVSDTGCGMDLETQKRVFEPFFTTKGIGKGTGLGLATVHGIVKQHGGHLNFESKPGQGTTFRIYLPALPKDEERLPEAAKSDPLPRGHETILVVEDEPAIRRLSCQLLTSQGYQVLEAKDATDAIRLAREGRAIDLLFTDVVMPQMSGRQVFDQIAAMRPGLKALYASGYTEDVIAHHGVLDPTIHFLQKPFTGAALARKVREAITTSPGA